MPFLMSDPASAPPSTRRAVLILALIGLGLFELGSAPASGQDPARRRVPEALNFANGLFRDRRYELAAEES